MGNQQKTPQWDRSHHSIFEDFALDLQGFTKTAEGPDRKLTGILRKS